MLLCLSATPLSPRESLIMALLLWHHYPSNVTIFYCWVCNIWHECVLAPLGEHLGCFQATLFNDIMNNCGNLCVCVCVCVMNVMCVWAYSPVWAHVEARDQKLTLECLPSFYFVRHGLSLDLKFAFALNWLARKLLGFACLCLLSPRTGVNVHVTMSSVYHGCLWLNWWSRNKCFTH